MEEKKRIKEWILYGVMNFVCQFKGHEPEKFLTETELYINTTRCKRCKRTLMDGVNLKLKHIPPPNSTPKQIKDWEYYCENKWQRLRNSCV